MEGSPRDLEYMSTEASGKMISELEVLQFERITPDDKGERKHGMRRLFQSEVVGHRGVEKGTRSWHVWGPANCGVARETVGSQPNSEEPLRPAEALCLQSPQS
jgi:hypothetical protein